MIKINTLSLPLKTLLLNKNILLIKTNKIVSSVKYNNESHKK